MNIYQFMSDSPYLAFFLAWIICFFGYHTIRVLLIYCISRPLRAMNIRKHGWPNPPMDADGDIITRGEPND